MADDALRLVTQHAAAAGKLVITHLLKLPAPVKGLRAACLDVEYLHLRDSFVRERVHVLVASILDVTCQDCLRAHGIAPAGPRCVDADGREVSL